MLFFSSTYAGDPRGLAEPARANTYFSYPYRLPQDERRFDRDIGHFTAGANTPGDMGKTARRTYATVRILLQALMDMKENFYRDYFLDIIGAIQDVEFPLYERLSFGPGQRYASKGCYIVQVLPGAKPELARRSEWVMH